MGESAEFDENDGFGSCWLLGPIYDGIDARQLGNERVAEAVEPLGQIICVPLGFPWIVGDGHRRRVRLRDIEPRLHLENREIEQLSAIDQTLRIERQISKGAGQRVVRRGGHHHGNRAPGQHRARTTTHRKKAQSRRTAARLSEVHVRVGMVAAHDVDVGRERLRDVPVHVERGGENASGANQLAHLPDDLALGVVEIRRLQRAMKREEDRVQRQVRLDRRQEPRQERFHDLGRGGTAALGAKRRAEHDLRLV